MMQRFVGVSTDQCVFAWLDFLSTVAIHQADEELAESQIFQKEIYLYWLTAVDNSENNFPKYSQKEEKCRVQ
jgi:hypothetical protein